MNPQELKTIMSSGLLSFPVTDFDAQGDFNAKGYEARLAELEAERAAAARAAPAPDDGRAMALLLRVMSTPFGHLVAAWQSLIVIVAIASMVLGAFAAIGQTNIKRLMAYSSIANMGYALAGLAVGTPDGVREVISGEVSVRVSPAGKETSC